MNIILDECGILDVPDAEADDHARQSAALKSDEGAEQESVNEPRSSGLSEFDYANALAARLPLIKTIGNEWHAYEKGAWNKTDRAGFRPAAQNILPTRIRTERRASAVLDHIEGRFQVARDSLIGFYKFAADGGVLINVANGVVALTSDGIKLLSHDPAYNFTTRTAAAYDSEATAPLFKTVLSQALPDKDDCWLYQLCGGNILLPDCRHEVAFINYGEAGRCKSTPAEAIAGTLGPDLVPRLSMGQICDPKSYHLPKLRHAAVNLGTELDAIEMGDSAAFKAIVSGEPVEARPIYGAPFTMRTTSKLLFLANGLPRFKHGTEAELRRMRFIRFDYLPPKKDITLKARLAAERDGILLWMLHGLRELLTLAEIPLGGKDSRAVHDRFRISNDPVGTFIKLQCHLDGSARVEKSKLALAYEEFCTRYELAVGCKDWFFRVLYERWPNLSEARPGSGLNRARVVTGLALNP